MEVRQPVRLSYSSSDYKKGGSSVEKLIRDYVEQSSLTWTDRISIILTQSVAKGSM
jgi:hypothetical protein